jgi:hypothetical protein
MNTLKTAAILLLVLCVGVLITLLQLKGSALHKAQLDLLARDIGDRRKEEGAVIAAAKEVFARSLAEYLKHVK